MVHWAQSISPHTARLAGQYLVARKLRMNACVEQVDYQTTEASVLEQFLECARDPANGIWLDTVNAISGYIDRQEMGRGGETVPKVQL